MDEQLATVTAPRYLLIPGYVRSKTDGDRHYIGAVELARLYRVPISDCVVLPDPEPGDFLGGRRRTDLLARADAGEFIPLSPRFDGDYRIQMREAP